MSDEIEVGTTPEIEDDSPSIEDTLRATWDEIQTRDEGDESAGPTRDEHGRFAARAQEAEQAPGQEQPAPDAAPAQPDIAVPPSSLNAQEKEEWATAGPALRAAFHRREQDFHNGIQQYKGDALWARQFYEMAPDMQELKNLYGSEAVGVKTLLEISAFARDDPNGFIQWFARERGLQLNAGPGVDNHQPQANDLLYQEMTALRQRLDQQEYAQAKVEAEDVLKEIQGFASKPNAEHFEALRPAMAGLLQSGLANSLEDAYEKALWQSPDIRSKILAQQQDEAAKKALEEARSKATRAKAARSGISHRGNYGSKPSGKGQSMEDTLRQTLEQMGFQ